MENQRNLEDKFAEWQIPFEEPIFQYINEKRNKLGGTDKLPEDEQEYYHYQTFTFKLEMTALSFVVPINIFTILYSRESAKLTKNLNKIKFYHWGSMISLVPGVATFAYSIFRRYASEIPHEKRLSEKYYSELSNYSKK